MKVDHMTFTSRTHEPLDPKAAIRIPAGFYGEEYAQANSCFVNVASLVIMHGGATVFGWLKGDVIFPDRPVIQAWVHHCVWRDRFGNLYDVTPQIHGTIEGRIWAGLPNFVYFIVDETAQLVDVGDGLVRSRTQRYTPIVQGDTMVEAAIVYFERADTALDDGDLARESYWVQRAFNALRSYGEPPRLMQSVKIRSFRLPTGLGTFD